MEGPKKRNCVECEDAPSAMLCVECGDEFCELCFSWFHKTGQRAKHEARSVGDAVNKEGTTRAFAAATAKDREEAASRLALNQISVAGAISGEEALAALADRAQFLPMRLDDDERELLRLLEGALRVSEYTDHVDVSSNDYGWGFSFYSGGMTSKKKETKMKTCVMEVFRLMLGLHLCFDFKSGQKRVKDELVKNGPFFRKLFEVGRRYKIMNPDKMRSTYGKLVHILQDVGSPDVYDFPCNQPVETVYSFLKNKSRLDLLADTDLLRDACDCVDLRVLSGEQQREVGARRNKAIEALKARHVGLNKLTESELLLIINSIADGNAYVAACRNPVDKMINYLKTYFDPDARNPSEEDSLAIRSGRGGSCLTHDHGTQFTFVMQSLQLWREIQNQMFRLWICADTDLQNQSNPYRLYNTGQGMHRVQSAPQVSRAMSDILGIVKSRLSGWVGLSVVHLGDRDVPNALVFIDKYTQVPRILGPIVLTLERLGVMCAEDSLLNAHVEKEYGGVEKLRKVILRDFFRHGFDGSGDDGGSCIDGRLTSAWNWCSLLNKKPYAHIFLLTGFEGFDGSFKQ